MLKKDIAAEFNISIIQVEALQKSVTKKLSDVDLVHFLSVCKSSGLDPFRKEINGYKDTKGRLVITTGRDGFLTAAQRNPLFNGIRSIEVCEADEVFSLDIPNGKVNHVTDPRKERGAIIGAYAIAFRKNGEPTVEWADLKTYTTGKDIWKTNEAEMIKKVAEAHALKKAFGVSGIQSEYDFKENNDGFIHSIKEQDQDEVKLNELKELFENNIGSMGDDYIQRVRNIIKNKEVSSYNKIIKDLSSK